MLRTRVIPCLLLKDGGLVKTIRFSKPEYVGDPINAIRIFNDKEVDELILLDITATKEGRGPAFSTIEDIASECFMPVAYGGGIRTLDDIRKILKAGIEKIVINSAAFHDSELISNASKEFGSQAIVVSVDVKRKMFGRYEVYADGGSKATGYNPIDYMKKLEQMGAGEIFLTAIDRDGTLEGYDHELLAKVCSEVSIPVIAAGGASSLSDFSKAVKQSGASAVSGGAIFVFQGKYRAVLITYPDPISLNAAFSD